MRVISPLLKKIVYPGMHHARLLRCIASFGGGCAIVNYHGVIPPGYTSSDVFLDGNLVSLEGLQKQLRFLKTNYEIVQPEAFREWVLNGRALPARAVLVTCDDGLANVLDNMFAIFRGEGIECLFFITGASCSESPGMLWYEELYHLLRSGQLSETELQLLLGDSAPQLTTGSFQAVWWRAVLGASRLSASARSDMMGALRSKCPADSSTLCESRWRLMNLRELLRLARAGATIGAHTMTHPVLSECSQEESFREISESKVALERALGKQVWAFAYPFGNPATMGPREQDLARQAGFECAFLNAGGGFAERSHPFALSRTHITADMSIAELEAHMIGFHARLQNAVRG